MVTVDFKDQFKEYQKIQNLIILTTNTDSESIYQMATKLNTKDIIFFEEEIDYIANRIKEVIRR